MKQFICFIFVIWGFSISVNANGYYTIVAPGSIQSDTEYAVTVSLHNNPEPATIKVGITGPSYNESKTIELSAYTAETLKFNVPSLVEGTYELQTEGMSGIIFKRFSNLTFSKPERHIYLQTDKALYKPGELVKYRVVVLDSDGKPLKTNNDLAVRIYDSAHNVIQELKELQFTKGVYSGKFKLSEQPVMGDWTIEVLNVKERQLQLQNKPSLPATVQGGQFMPSMQYAHPGQYVPGMQNARPMQVFPGMQGPYPRQFVPGTQVTHTYAGRKAFKNFEVAKYVLPKFSVEIEADEKIAILDKTFKVTVRAKYTHGQPVQGNTTITASFVHQTHFDNSLPAAQKTVEIYGKADVEFDLNQDLAMDQFIPRIKIIATVTEGHTGLQQNTSTIINLHQARYTIDVDMKDKKFVTNIPFEIKAIIKKLNGSPVTNAKSTAKLILKRDSHDINGLIFEADVDTKGMAVFKIKIGWPMSYNSIKVIYEEKEHTTYGFRVERPAEPEVKETVIKPSAVSTPKTYYPSQGVYVHPHPSIERVGPLKVTIQKLDFNPDHDVIIEVKSDDPIPYYFYTIMARGKIIKHEYVKVEGNQKYHRLKIQTTNEMAPRAKLFVYLIDDGEMKSDEEDIFIPLKLQNKLEITAPEKANASELVSLNIKTDPDSFVGLLAVDQSVLLLKTGNDFDKEKILDNIGNVKPRAPDTNGRHETYPGKNSGFVTITNACYPRASYHQYEEQALRYDTSYRPTGASYAMPGMGFASPAAMSFASPSNDPPVIRKNFVETWIFDDIESTDSEGIANFTRNIPDTMTSWVITGFSLNENTGFGMTENATNILVSQPFFVSLNLPYAVKRGEIVNIPVVVFNYMATQVEAEITMENVDDEYDFVGTDGNVLTDKVMSQQVTVPTNIGNVVSFTIFPKRVGYITLKVKAVTPLAGDIVHQKLKVEPEGVTQYKNEALFVNIPANGEPLKHTFKAEIPADAVVDSEFIEFTAVSDLLGPTIENIDRLVRMPYGCGEQNMINFVPNILVLDYLETMQIDNPTLTEKAKAFMLNGYQRQLTYKHQNGAYSSFGEGHSNPDNWLTAYVARSFIRARKYITIDEMLIENALEYLASTQEESGEFVSMRYNFYSTKQSDGVGKTAYILLAFLENQEYALKFKTQIRKGLNYLQSHFANEDDLHTLALISLVFQRAKHDSLPKLLVKLEHRSHNENNLKWWKTSEKYRSNDIEITAYILQTLLESKDVDATTVLPTLKWLVGKRNSLGGFASTQDTVVGLEALIKFAEKFAAAGRGSINIKFHTQNEAGEEISSNEFTIDETTGLGLISHEFNRSTRQLTVSAEGQGSALLQFSYRYNLVTKDDNAGFLIRYSLNKESTSDHISMNVCAEYEAEADDEIKESNMAVMEIYLPSGYKTDHDSLQFIRSTALVQRVDTKNDETVIIVYFDMLFAGEPICFDIFAENYHKVDKLKPAAITVYDYYNSKKRATVFYEVK
ncbi:CD109 antigen [Stomoxys calcitrans]|uniref:CD109 antigen n=1 Tax=Stomoxys calcitrans TaxID=35570 RepID=UPI0027E26FB3|nr:CD109 antigen [Stomoxys calcitrans]